MPVFGARMVCDSGNYKLVKERQKNQLKREISLGRYEVIILCKSREFKKEQNLTEQMERAIHQFHFSM